jgi:hypothetical protein
VHEYILLALIKTIIYLTSFLLEACQQRGVCRRFDASRRQLDSRSEEGTGFKLVKHKRSYHVRNMMHGDKLMKLQKKNVLEMIASWHNFSICVQLLGQCLKVVYLLCIWYLSKVDWDETICGNVFPSCYDQAHMAEVEHCNSLKGRQAENCHCIE